MDYRKKISQLLEPSEVHCCPIVVKLHNLLKALKARCFSSIVRRLNSLFGPLEVQ